MNPSISGPEMSEDEWGPDDDAIMELAEKVRVARAALQNVANDLRANAGYVTTSVGGQVDLALMKLDSGKVQVRE